VTLDCSARDVRPGRWPATSAVTLLAALAIVIPAIAPPAAAGSSYEESWDAPADTFSVTRTDMLITIDGALDEPAWAEALVLNLDYEVQPGENIPPPVRTEILVSYDDEHVYFGFRAFDPDPDRIRARYSDRDEAWSDDFVGVAIDTFNDERRAYELLANPLGVQMDAINDDVMNEYDDSWNAIWDSASSASRRATASRRPGDSMPSAATRAPTATTSGCSPATAATTATSARPSSWSGWRRRTPAAISRSYRR
jgi:hypothetical protein